MIYSNIEYSKDNCPIPIFKSGKPMHSKYNPQREAEGICRNLCTSDFFLVLGLGGGYLIKELKKVFPKSTIIIYENSLEDLNFLCKSIEGLNDFLIKNNIHCLETDQIESSLPYFFKPALMNTFQVVENRNWNSEIGEKYSLIKKSIKKTIDLISKDYSVQCHFGKFMQHNILKNARFLKKVQNMKFPTEKTAVVVAAGPSLDSKIEFLKRNINDFFVIATDTANQNLLKNHIKINAVVSIDGQNISYLHFMNESSSKIYIFDDSCNSKAFRNAAKRNKTIIDFENGHPLSSYIFGFQNEKLHLSSGSGTVTIAACDFASNAGFKKILVLGADFGYLNGKPYCKGTYLDRIYKEFENRTNNSESSYTKLMFRSKNLIKENNKITSDLLKSYEKTFKDWALNNGFTLNEKDNIYKLSKTSASSREIKTFAFDFSSFSRKINAVEKKELLKDENLQTALLPYIAFLKTNGKDNHKPEELLNVALEDLLRYT